MGFIIQSIIGAFAILGFVLVAAIVADKAVAIVDILSVSEWKKEELEDACGSYWEDGWFGWKISNIRPIRVQDRQAPIDNNPAFQYTFS